MPAPVEIGDVLADKFRITRVLGEGGMGVVYEALHSSLGERVAIKVLHGDARSGADGRPRLLREARAAARIKSEHVARVSDFGVIADGTPFLVMELVDGKSVAALLRDNGPFEVQAAVHHALETCLALAEAHALGIVHRDIKPSNLILATRRDGSELIKVLDFGVAKQIAADDAAVTASDRVLGSPSYMSPEQIRDARTVDEQSDIWSLGVSLYEMLTARLPFEAFTSSGVLAAVTSDPHVPLGERNPALDAELGRVIDKCLAKDRRERYPRVVELALDLQHFVPEGADLVRRIRRLRETPHEERAAAEPSKPLAPANSANDAPTEAASTQNATATTARTPSGAPFARTALLVAAAVAAIVVAGYGLSDHKPPPLLRTAIGPVAAAIPRVQPAEPAATPVPTTAPAPEPTREREMPTVVRPGAAPRASTHSPAPKASAPGDAYEYGYRK